MPIYNWKGVALDGHYKKGIIDAQSRSEVQQKLFQQSIALLHCKEARRLISFADHSSFFRNYNPERIVFFEHMALLLGSGVSLSQALTLYVKQAGHKQFKKVVTSIIDRVENGYHLSQAMKDYQSLFPLFIIHLTHAAEKTGKLAFVFSRISEYLKEQQRLKNKLKQAALLPVITMIFATIIITGIFLFIIPQFNSFFQMMGKPIPPLTQKIIAVSEFIRQPYGLIMILSFLVLPIFMKFFLQIAMFKRCKDRLMIALSFHFILSDWVSFLEVLSLFLEAGIPLSKALIESSSMINNSILQEKILFSCDLINQGKSLAVSLAHHNNRIVPQKLIALISLGEESGTLDFMIGKAIVIFNTELKYFLTIITTILQPFLLLCIGLIITFLMVAVYLPIFNLATIIT